MRVQPTPKLWYGYSTQELKKLYKKTKESTKSE